MLGARKRAARGYRSNSGRYRAASRPATRQTVRRPPGSRVRLWLIPPFGPPSARPPDQRHARRPKRLRRVRLRPTPTGSTSSPISKPDRPVRDMPQEQLRVKKVKFLYWGFFLGRLHGLSLIKRGGTQIFPPAPLFSGASVVFAKTLYSLRNTLHSARYHLTMVFTGLT